MTQGVATAALAATLAACAHAPGAPGAGEGVAEILRLDAAGGRAAARRDMAGTLAGFGDDAVYCGSRGVALGRDGLAAAWKPWFSPGGPLVTWTPERAGVAASADLGWSAGRSRVERPGPDGRPAVATGEYVTAWSRSGGAWRAVLDLAGSRPAAELGPGLERREVRALRSAAGDLEAAMGLWQRRAGEGPQAGAYLTVRRRDGGGWQVVEDRAAAFAGGEALAGEVVLLDAAWARTVEQGNGEGFRALVAEDALFAGRALLRGREGVWNGWKGFFAEGGPRIRWTPAAGGGAGSRDLAWTTGRYRLERRGPDGRPAFSEGEYLTVWVRDAGAGWRVAMDGSLENAAALGPMERVPLRTLASRDGSLEASLGTWKQDGASGRRSGAWIAVRQRAREGWKTLFETAVVFASPG